MAVHSYGPDGARDAVRAGATSVEHAIDIDDATLREMARRGVTYVPTVDHNRYYAEHKADFGYGDSAVAALNAYRARNLETVRRAIRARVPIATRRHCASSLWPRVATTMKLFQPIDCNRQILLLLGQSFLIVWQGEIIVEDAVIPKVAPESSQAERFQFKRIFKRSLSARFSFLWRHLTCSSSFPLWRSWWLRIQGNWNGNKWAFLRSRRCAGLGHDEASASFLWRGIEFASGRTSE